jgi:hypothetical protein
MSSSMVVPHTAGAAMPRLPSLRTIVNDASYLLVSMPVGVAAFSLAVTGVSLAAGLAITLVGIPVLLLTLLACRGIADLERLRAAPVLGARIAATERPWRQDGVWATTKAIVGDPAAWRDLAWSILLLPIGTATFSVAITAWSTSIGLVTSPLWYWALPDDNDAIPLVDSTSLGWSALRVAIGLVLIPVTIGLCRALAQGTARAAAFTLGPVGTR